MPTWGYWALAVIFLAVSAVGMRSYRRTGYAIGLMVAAPAVLLGVLSLYFAIGNTVR